MTSFFLVFRQVLLFVALALPGFFLTKKEILKKEHTIAFSQFLTRVSFPLFIFSGTVTNLTLDRSFLLLLVRVLPAVVFGVAVMIFLTALFHRKTKDAKKRGMMQFCATFSNSGFLGIPLAMAIFGSSSPVIIAMILMNILSNILLYTWGIFLISGDRRDISLKKAFLNPVFLAFVVALFWRFFALDRVVPELGSFASYFSNVVTPLSMTVLGMKMASASFSKLALSWNNYAVSLNKLVLCPVLVVGVFAALRYWFPSLATDSFLQALFFTFAMPTAGLASSFADGFGGDDEGAVQYTLSTTLLCVLTVPCLYWLLDLVIR
jgi:predicted permease